VQLAGWGLMHSDFRKDLMGAAERVSVLFMREFLYGDRTGQASPTPLVGHVQPA